MPKNLLSGADKPISAPLGSESIVI